MTKVITLISLLGYILSGYGQTSMGVIKNPIINGYFADPSIIKHGNTFYIYATLDPWGGEELAVFQTCDLINFSRKHINWPTKKACTSPTSGGAMVWAPSVVKANDGRFYMYVKKKMMFCVSCVSIA
jgi:beta-xylosidase